jgi:flagellar basal-body rod protein FlgB
MSDMSVAGFGTTVDLLGNAIAGADAEHAAVADNIANVNTPGYRRESVSFKDALAQAEGSAQNGDLGMLSNDARDLGGDSPAFAPKLQIDTVDRMRADGSNVDVDQEMAQLSQNSSYEQTMSQLLQVQFMRLREAITEQTH